MPNWKVKNTIVRISSPWVEVVAENLLDNKGNPCEYWRVEKADSIIIIPCYNGSIIVPKPSYRHGIQKETYDFPGGRRERDEDIRKSALSILSRELKIKKQDVIDLNLLNETPWYVNSSFSNQRLYGFTARISSTALLPQCLNIESFSMEEDMKPLLNKLSCLQCRGVLLEWLYYYKN